MKEQTNHALLRSMVEEHRLDEIFDQDAINEMHLYQAQKGDILCAKGDRLHHLYFLVQGKIKIFTSLPNGRSLLLRFNNPLSIIGDVEFVTQPEARSTVEFVQAGMLVAISFHFLHERYRDHPKFLRFILQKIGQKLTSSSHSTSLNLLYPVENRFASYLLSTMPDELNAVSSDELKASNLTEVAELLGTSYRHLNRVIRNLCAASVIERRKGALYITNREKIKELACGNIYE